MRKIILFIALIAIAGTVSAQNLITTKVVVSNDSIYEMSRTNGREQILVASPGTGKSLIVENIAVVNKVGSQRLYSPDSGSALYKIGYRNQSYWYDISSFPWESLNVEANSTYSFIPMVDKTIWDGSKINNSPLVLRFDKAMNFNNGSNELTIYITYWIIE